MALLSGLLLLYAIIGAHINTSLDLLRGKNVAMVFIFGFAILVGAYANDFSKWLVARKWRLKSVYKPHFMGLLLAIACVIISRTTDVSPGYLFGIPMGLFIVSELPKTKVYRLEFFGVLWMIVMALIVWGLMPILKPWQIISDFDTLLYVILIEALFFLMLPLGYLRGSIVFSWKKNGQVLGSLSGRGKSNVSIPAPYLYGTDIVSVEAVSTDESFAGSASVAIPSVDPIVRLYQDHPLFGLRLDYALASTTRIIDREMTFAAIPFFATASSPADDALLYTWTVDGKPVTTSGETKHELTLGASAGGEARLSVGISHASNIFFGVENSWRIIFNSSLGADSPFDSN